MPLSVLTGSQSKDWDSIVRSFSNYDVYYLSGYVKAFQLHGDGEPLFFYYEGDDVRGINVVMKRDIAKDPHFLGKLTENTYCDFATPYGYGGWLIEGSGDRKPLYSVYQDWCKEHGIVSEFVRFHPIFQNALDLKDFYTVEYSRHTIGTNLHDFDDPVQCEFGKSARREVRNAQVAGAIIKLKRNPDDLGVFQRFYRETMERNQAKECYFFQEEHFYTLLKDVGKSLLEIQLWYEEEPIASEIYFVEGKVMHAHLLGSSQKMLELRGGALIEASAARWGKENGYSYIHHGGGRTSATDDTLYMYKKKFGKHAYSASRTTSARSFSDAFTQESDITI